MLSLMCSVLYTRCVVHQTARGSVCYLGCSWPAEPEPSRKLSTPMACSSLTLLRTKAQVTVGPSQAAPCTCTHCSCTAWAVLTSFPVCTGTCWLGRRERRLLSRSLSLFFSMRCFVTLMAGGGGSSNGIFWW